MDVPQIGANFKEIDAEKALAPLCNSVDKITGLIGAGVSAAYKPFGTVLQAGADAIAAQIKDSSDNSIEHRAMRREMAAAVRGQQNIESIAEKAVHLLPPQVSSDPVNPDWASQFFDTIKHIGDKELQELWARLLASEVQSPGTVSVRTLAIVRNLSKSEATIFAKLCPLLWVMSPYGGSLLPKIANEDTPSPDYFRLDDFGLHLSDIMILTHAGLLHESSAATFAQFYRGHTKLKIGGQCFVIDNSLDEKFSIPIITPTLAANELLRCCTMESNPKYIKRCIKFAEHYGLKLVPE